jgi:hypothetical protein
MDAGRVQEVMRSSIEEHFEVPPAYEKVVDPEALLAAQVGQRLTLIERIRRGLASRVEEGNNITYRKHYLTLLSETWWQIILGLA